jgi:thiosulfate/3-mercaptopyruvate sulfurtransferase
MRPRSFLQSGITRRGLLVGAGLVAAPFVIRSRPASVAPVAPPAERSYPRGDLLTAPADLYQRIVVDRLPTRILDATDLATYRDRHIPGALHVWWQDTMELNATWYGMVLKPDDGQSNQSRRRRFLERLGINAGDSVIVYGDTENTAAARVVWFLRFLGIDASMLDGGRAGWLGMSGPMTDTVPSIAESANPAINPQQNYYLFASEIASRLGQPGIQIIDLRNPDERNGGPYQLMQIPGAVDLARSSLMGSDGLIRPAVELGQLFAQAGIDLSAQLMLVAPTGVEASLSWLALSLVGAATVTLSDGGWQEWAHQTGLPITTMATVGPNVARRMG